MKYTPRELILLILAMMVFIVVVAPVIGLVVEVLTTHQNPSRPEFLKATSDIVIYVLGILSGYVLSKPADKQ